MNVPIIAIDGPSGSGKGYLAQRLAEAFGFHLLDSGALYRLVGLAAFKAGTDLNDAAALTEVAATMAVAFDATGDATQPLLIRLDGDDVTQAVRTDDAGVRASIVAAIQPVRDAIFELQRSFWRPPGLVADGRDMGTVVFPEAVLKIFLDASPEARAQRRYNQLKDKDIAVSLPDLLESIRERDLRDRTRTVSPLVPAADAIVLDSTGLSREEVFSVAMAHATTVIGR